ncbi:MAG: GH116 family glycosyl hydrolase [Firmicutes bacterium]|nr:GH116 family glycosyl hydrolase [Bacillota bacterium]
MPRYSSTDELKSGVPLGGIGAGKIEILPNGCITHFTHQNNWAKPMNAPGELNGVDARVGYHFGARVRTSGRDGRVVARLLQTAQVADIPCVEGIDYEGSYPFARLHYRDRELPVEIRLEAFSPIIPGDSTSSRMPAAIFLFHIKNGAEQSEVSIMATARNTVGEWNVGRFNELLDDQDATGIVFRTDRPLPFDTTAGSVCLATAKTAAVTSYELAWNLKTADPFDLRLENENLACWRKFLETGWLSSGRLLGWEGGRQTGCLSHVTERSEVVTGEGVELAGAVVASMILEPGEERMVPFVLAWHMPAHHAGHIYEHDFEDAREVAREVLRNVDTLRAGSLAWGNALSPAGLPEWLNDSLVNNLYVLSSGSWWDRQGRFALFEASRTCQLMSTVDVLYYASIPLAWCYPDLERNCLGQIARAQREDGYIPHDLGRARLDYPSDGTTAPPRWKDLCPKFALMAYRDWLWIGGDGFIEEFYPRVKRALLWEMATDRNGDGLPDNEGPDQTFDNWSFRGANSYTSSIYLAALRATSKMADAAGDSTFARACDSAFERAVGSFEAQLWTGEYYRAVAGGSGTGGAQGDTCTVGQLNGQWYAHLLGLGYILPREHVNSAVSAMIRLNGGIAPYGAVNSVLPGGCVDRSNPHSANIWPGETYALAALAIYEGFVDEGLHLTRQVWENMALRVMNPWDQPDVVNSEDGGYGFGDHYMRNMVVWAVAFALADRNQRVRRALLTVGSGRPPLSWGDENPGC